MYTTLQCSLCALLLLTDLTHTARTRTHCCCSYLETDVEIGSSSVAASVTRLSIGYAKTLVVELAWAIQGETEEELPEVIIGTTTKF
jgi:Protein ENHANCED DISEASE RESISTANCE 2, C-terminal